LLERFLEFLRDPEVQRLQVPYWLEKVRSDRDPKLSPLSNALIVAVGNSNNKGTAVAPIIEDLKQAEADGDKRQVLRLQRKLGEAYMADEGNAAYQLVAKIAWDTALESRSLEAGSADGSWAAAIAIAETQPGYPPKNLDPGTGPKHRLKRLLRVIDKHR